jgi:hypothetical protein
MQYKEREITMYTIMVGAPVVLRRERKRGWFKYHSTKSASCCVMDRSDDVR